MALKTVILVEDRADEILLARHAISKAKVKLNLVSCRNGESFLEHLVSNPAPALVLIDLKLPDIGGIDLIRHVRSGERTRFIPVVVLSSSTLRQDLIDSYSAGANGYLTKPVDFGEFATMIDTATQYWTSCNSVPYSERE